MYSSNRSTELNLASTSVACLTTNWRMPVSWKTQKHFVNKHVGFTFNVSLKNKPVINEFTVRKYLYCVRHGQAFQGWTDEIVTAEHYKQSHQQGHGQSHEVQPEREQACPRVIEEIVVGVDVIQGLEPTIRHRTGQGLRTPPYPNYQ